MTVRRRTAAGLLVACLLAMPAFAQEIRLRLATSDAEALPIVRAGAGTSGVGGIETRLLLGDPTKAGPYTISIRVPPDTHIAAHSHRDNRSAIVAKGVWHFGYGPKADDAASKALPVGSYYTEPAEDPHFAWTGPEGATVYISGVGPSDTRFTAK